MERTILILKPALTRSPACNSDIATDLPFSPFTLAIDGKHPPPPDDDDDSSVRPISIIVIILPSGSKYCIFFDCYINIHDFKKVKYIFNDGNTFYLKLI